VTDVTNPLASEASSAQVESQKITVRISIILLMIILADGILTSADGVEVILQVNPLVVEVRGEGGGATDLWLGSEE
jgi:hypothetical protein